MSRFLPKWVGNICSCSAMGSINRAYKMSLRWPRSVSVPKKPISALHWRQFYWLCFGVWLCTSNTYVPCIDPNSVWMVEYLDTHSRIETTGCRLSSSTAASYLYPFIRIWQFKCKPTRCDQGDINYENLLKYLFRLCR